MREAIEAAIADDPTDLGNYGVLADWLQAHEPKDPRGELITLMLAYEHDPDSRVRLRKEIEGVLAKHADALLGPLAGDSRGFDQPPLVWRAGFLQRLELHSVPRATEILTTVLEHPSGQFLTELVATGAGQKNTIELVARTPRLLRRLELGANQDLGRLDAMIAAVPQLRHLVLHANGFDAEPFHLPHLEYATFVVPFSTRGLGAVAAARWPKLVHLRIMHTGDNPQVAALQPLFDRDDLPNLRYLALDNFHTVELELVQRLVRAPWLGQLVALDLMGNRITDREAFALAKEPGRFRSDVQLVVPTEHLSPRGVAALRVLDPGFRA